MKIGILGAGWGARVQLPLLRVAGFSELLLWGRSPEKARAAAAANGAEARDDWRAVIAASDLVFVTTPVFQHREMVLAALEAGRHVICEKPFALNETEATEMAAAASVAERVAKRVAKMTHPACKAFVDHELRLLPGRRKLRELIRAGEAGEITAVEIHDLRGGRLSPEGPWSWWSDASLGGGAWNALGSHWLDTLRWLIGDVDLRGCDLAAVNKSRRDGAQEKIVTADDYASAWGRAGNQIPFIMHINLAAPGIPQDRLVVRGRKAVYRLDGDGRLFGQPEGAAEAEISGPIESLPPGMPVNGYTLGSLALARALKHADESGDWAGVDLASFADGLAIQKLLDRGRVLAGSRG